MESSSTKRNPQNVPQDQFGLEFFNLQRPQLPRDSRGSLEVFQPQALRAKSDNCTSVVAPESKLDAPVLLKRNGVRDQVFPKDVTRSVESRLDLETGCLSKSQQGTVLRAAARSLAPVLCDLDPRAQHKHVPRPSLSKQAEQQNMQEEKPLTEDVAAERAAGWGLVLKAEEGSGKIEGVGVRNSGDSSQRNSGTSSCIRTSEESDAGVEAVRVNPHIPRVSEDLKDALSSFQQTFVVADATRPDYPILYASAGFFSMTGYTAKEVIGRNCRFLQGADTDPADVSKIRHSLEQGKSFCGRLLNYKKDGTPFWNLLTIAPIKDENGKLLKYIGMLVEVSKFTEGSKDKALRPNGLPESLIKYDARQKNTLADSVFELVEVFKKPISVQGPPLVVNADGGEKAQQLPGKRVSGGNLTEVPEASPLNGKGHKKKRRSSSIPSFLRFSEKASGTPDSFDLAQVAMKTGNEGPESIDDLERKKQIRRGIDLATTLERIEKNFVITDPRLPDNPIIFASDSFLELTEYSREEILGKNCRFLQGPDTNPETVKQIRDAIREQRSVTVQLLNYTKSGKPFWNLFHLQPMRDHKGELQYFIGVQLDGSAHFDSARKRLPETIEQDGVQVIQSTAGTVDNAVRELPDANQTPEGLWARYSKLVLPKPHKAHTASWAAINKIVKNDGFVSLEHFRPVKSLGFGDTGGVHLVELRGTGHFFAMKAMDKALMLTRNKVHRTFIEREILDMMDHPFLPTLYASFQTDKHVCLITDFCPGGELFLLLDRQPSKTFHEDTACFYAAEVVVALEYLHCKGVVYRDLKPENILVQSNGHLSLADFDLSFLSSSRPQLIMPATKPEGHKKSEEAVPPIFVAEPVARSNSFVGTEEYIAPEVINGSGHSSAVDWWALGILLYEMLYGWTPFRGKNRQKTFSNVLHKDVTFPSSIPTSLAARQLIHGLLQKDPAKRLGSSSGANELKRQPFFSDIYWPLIRCLSPPKLDTPVTLIDEFKMKGSSADNYDVF